MCRVLFHSHSEWLWYIVKSLNYWFDFRMLFTHFFLLHSLLLLSSVFTCVWALLSKSLHSLNNTATHRQRMRGRKKSTQTKKRKQQPHSFTLTWYEMAFISFCKDVPALQNATKTSNEWQLLLIVECALYLSGIRTMLVFIETSRWHYVDDGNNCEITPKSSTCTISLL